MTDDYQKRIKTMQEFCSPEGQAQRLRDQWSKATKIHAIHVQYSDPAPDGDFEILFVPPEKLAQAMDCTFGITTEISIENAAFLAAQDDCSGGSYALADLRAIADVAPALLPDGLEI